MAHHKVHTAHSRRHMCVCWWWCDRTHRPDHAEKVTSWGSQAHSVVVWHKHRVPDCLPGALSIGTFHRCVPQCLTTPGSARSPHNVRTGTSSTHRAQPAHTTIPGRQRQCATMCAHGLLVPHVLHLLTVPWKTGLMAQCTWGMFWCATAHCACTCLVFLRALWAHKVRIHSVCPRSNSTPA